MMKFTEGEEVLARHPKTAEFQKGKILSTRGEKYKIKFDSGIEFIVPENDIKVERMSRAGARTSTRLGRKSPSRTSPSRKSPSRRSPARRSPGRSPARSPLARNKKLSTRSTRLAKVSIPRIDAVNDTKVDEKRTSPLKTVTENDDMEPIESMPMQLRLREVKTMTRRSMRLQASVLKPEQDHKLVMLSRSIDRAVSLPIERKSQLYEFPPDKERERGFSVQRDQDVYLGEDNTTGNQKESVVLEKRKKEISLVNEPQEWGGWLGTSILIFILPLSVILPQLICSNKRCKSMYIDIPRNLKSYLSPEAMLAYFGFLVFLGLTSLIPIGRRVDGQQSKTGRLQYRINGFLSAVLSLIIFGGCIYKKIPISHFILDKSVQFSISGWLIGTILSIILYMKSNKAPVAELNIYASTNSKIYNFWQGREINPRIWHFDFKLLLVRASTIGMILIDAAIITKCIQESKTYSIHDMNLTAILGASLQLFYALDFLIFESHYPTTFGCMYEGTGYMLCVGHLLYPYFYTLMTRILLHQKIPFSYFTGLATVGFFASYIIFRWSNWQKATFRNNPLAQSLARLETIPTSRGKKLLTSGWWGMVRHPNYLGDILIQSAIAFLTLTTDLLSYYPLLCCVIILMYRAVRDNERCKTRYGYAWEQYCSKVKYMIFKRIF